MLALALALALHAPPPALHPRLGVLIVVDQLSAHHFDQRLPSAHGGFRRLVDEGFRYLDARYEAAPALTSPGHATLSTGCYPEVNGIVANEWFDAVEHRATYSVEDARYPVLGDERPGEGLGPGHLKAHTLADAVKAESPEARVVALAGKDRSAILLAGEGADVALWLDHRRPAFTTSTAYGRALPEWVTPVNQRLQQALAAGLSWSLPRGGITGESTGERAFQRNMAGFGASWPHEVKKDASPKDQSEGLLHHPLANAALVDLAIASVRALKLGQRDASDLLTLSFSGFDLVVHAFGPDSSEAAATFQDLDQQLARLLSALDQEVGRGRYVVALTADHGGAPVPEVVRLRGVDAGRLDVDRLVGAVERAAHDGLGGGEWFQGFRGMGLYAAPGAAAELKRVEPKLREAARGVDGVLDLMSRDEVVSGGGGEAGALLRRGYDRDRSPDWFVLAKPHWIYGVKDATGHGSLHLYDRQIPLVWMGGGVRHGEGLRAEAVDVAPTLAFLLGTEPPSDAQGRVLGEALVRFK